MSYDNLKKVFSDSELEEVSVIRNFRITAADDKQYTTKHYNLAAIIAVGYKVNSERAVPFRKWATTIIQEFTIKGFTMDDERLKYDVSVAKNYLSDFKLGQMQRIVSAYLDMAEMQAMRKMPMTMADWEERLGGFLKLWDRDILQNAGRVTAELAKTHAESEFEKYRIVQDRLFESDFDRLLKKLSLLKCN